MAPGHNLSKANYCHIDQDSNHSLLLLDMHDNTLNCRIALKFDRHIDSIAADVPVKFQSDRTIINTNLAASRLHEILR